MPEPGLEGSITLDQLIALNDEIAALVRAGVPLERGLVEAARQIRGRVGDRAARLGDLLGQGRSLPEALGPAGLDLPEVYRAVVEAGARSGRLAQALEGMAGVTRGYAEARRAVGLALLYPALVVSLAYGLFVFFIVQVIPRYRAAFADFGLAEGATVGAQEWASRNVEYWAPIFPIALAVLAAGWLLSGRARSLDVGLAGGLAVRLPWVGRMLGDYRAANFADLLALLLDHRVPLAEATRLASRAAGPGAFRAEGEAFADRLGAGGGDGPGRGLAAGSPFPPLLAWMVTAGHRQGDLPVALRQAATTYRRKGEARAEVFRNALPATLMIGIGAGSVLAYGVMLFLPLRILWQDLAIPTR